MMWFAVLLLRLSINLVLGEVNTQRPEQVHLALGEEPTSMVVTWVTMSPTNQSALQIGVRDMSTTVIGWMSEFTDGGEAHRKLYMHRAIVTNLQARQTYIYRVGYDDNWSRQFSFRMTSSDNNWSPRLAVYGDMGAVNAQSLARLQRETQQGHLDAILHVGDFAYDLSSDNAKVGDQFMRNIESIASRVPYMTCVGNHEFPYMFANYRARFSMPKAGGDGQSMFYSFDLGPAHIIAFSTELYFYAQWFGLPNIVRWQQEWLERDLKKANANRAQRPWIITMAHRPQYCSNVGRNDCTKYHSWTRAMTEALFYKYGVDVTIWAHEHSYERMWPLYNHTVCKGSVSPYDNAPAPIHIVTGSAGCDEPHDLFKPEQPEWSAFRSDDYGYSRMTIHNGTHISWEQVSDDQAGKVIDSIVIIRDKHAAGMYTCHDSKGKQWSRKEHDTMKRWEDIRRKNWFRQ